MATYFLNCSENIENYNLCLKHNVAGFSQNGYEKGDFIYLIVKESDIWKIGARGKLGTETNDKPWRDASNYNSAFNIEWERISKKEITEGLRRIYSNFGLAIQGKKNLDLFQDKGEEVKKFLNSFFNNQNNNILHESAEYLIDEPMKPILTAIKTKPFILLAGISGTGKSRLVRTLAYKTCSKEELRKDPKKPGNFELIPVRPNWHDSSELMGYVSRINGEKYITTSFLKFIAKAWKHTDVPFFLCLDEMNLAPVEQYFAEYLSIIETRQVKNGELVTDYIISKESFENQNLYNQLLTDLELSGSEFSKGISIPSNLVIIGTVNMDETTHSFSRKVLDRAMTFEMNNVDLTAGLELSKNDWSYPNTYIAHDNVIGQYTSGAEVYTQTFKEKDEVISFLQKINNELDGTPFKIAYRVRDEFLIYCYYASQNPTDNWFDNALDELTSMKILSRIEGDEAKVGSILSNLQKILNSNFKKSNAKLREMEARLQLSGYTSFWS